MEIESIRFSGLASGIDTAAIVDALIEVERQPILRLQAQRGQVAQRQSLVREFSSLLLALRDAARTLDNQTSLLTGPSTTEEFLAFQATSSDEGVLVASSEAGGAPGIFDVQVTSLATVSRRVSYQVPTPDSPFTGGPGTLTVDFGGTAPIAVAVDPTMKLAELASAINADEDNDGSVRADVIATGNGTEQRLVIASTQTGVANRINVTTDFGPLFDPAFDQDGDDARLSVFGVPITRSANEISDAIPGVNLQLQAVGSAEVSVTRDDEAIGDALQAFVDAYNGVREFADTQSRFDETAKTAPPLQGESIVRNFEGLVRQAVGRQYDFGEPDPDFDSLGLVGVEFLRDGRLSLDRARLTEALDQDRLAVRRLLSGADNDLDPDGSEDGVMAAVVRVLEPVVRFGDGVFAQRDELFNDELRGLDDSIARFQVRLKDREQSLVRQFAALETFISATQAQSSFLASLASA